jgi:hypothetical protein
MNLNLFKKGSISRLFTKKVSSGKMVTYFYAVFTTTSNGITASAVCSYTIDQLKDSFEGDYKKEKSTSSKESSSSSSSSLLTLSSSTSLQTSSYPNPRPSDCAARYNTPLTYEQLIFSRKNVQMENEISSEALIVQSDQPSRFTNIDVDFNTIVSEKNETDSTFNDVLFVSSNDGRILEFVIRNEEDENMKLTQKLIYSEEIKSHLNESSMNILNLKFFHSNSSSGGLDNAKIESSRHLLIVMNDKVVTMPASYCYLKKNSSNCDQTLYPYCFWSIQKQKCLDFTKAAFLFDKQSKVVLNDEVFIENGTENINLTPTPSLSLVDISMSNDYNSSSSLSSSSKLENLLQLKTKQNNSKLSIHIYIFVAVSFVLIISSGACGACLTLCFFSGRHNINQRDNNSHLVKDIKNKFKNVYIIKTITNGPRKKNEKEDDKNKNDKSEQHLNPLSFHAISAYSMQQTSPSNTIGKLARFLFHLYH